MELRSKDLSSAGKVTFDWRKNIAKDNFLREDRGFVNLLFRDRKSFVHYILRFISVMLPISIVNSVLKYSLQEVALRCRTRFDSPNNCADLR
jgi:hypothetical protein